MCNICGSFILTQIPPAPQRPDFDSSREKLQKLGEGEGNMTKEEFSKMKQELEAYVIIFFTVCSLNREIIGKCFMNNSVDSLVRCGKSEMGRTKSLIAFEIELKKKCVKFFKEMFFFFQFFFQGVPSHLQKDCGNA